MKKLLFFLVILILTIPQTFATLTSNEKAVIKNAFLKYELSISKLSTNEQIARVEKLIDSIDLLSNSTKVKNNVILRDVLLELKSLARDKHNTITSNNSSGYVESEGMKAIICEQLGICETTSNNNTSSSIGNITTSGNLEVSLSFNSPNSQTIPSSGIVTFGRFDFTADGNDISISSITLAREGLGTARDIRRIYFEKNGVRISNLTSVASDNLAIIIFSPALIVNGGSTSTLDLIGELNATSGIGGEYRFSIRSANDIESDSKVVGTFPVRTYSMGIGAYTTGKVEVTNNNISTNYSPGNKNTTIGSFSIKASGNNDYIFQSIKLRNSGTANTNLLAGIGLYRNGQEVSSNVSVNSREITISIYDKITANGTANYELRSDMMYCKGYEYETNYYEGYEYYRCEDMQKDYFKFEIRNSYDISIVEEWSGYSPTINIVQ